MKMLDLAGKVCLVTGSAGGIGLEIVKVLLQKGAKCLMVDVNYKVSFEKKSSNKKPRKIFSTAVGFKVCYTLQK